jgi:hypothetical protein
MYKHQFEISPSPQFPTYARYFSGVVSELITRVNCQQRVRVDEQFFGTFTQIVITSAQEEDITLLVSVSEKEIPREPFSHGFNMPAMHLTDAVGEAASDYRKFLESLSQGSDYRIVPEEEVKNCLHPYVTIEFCRSSHQLAFRKAYSASGLRANLARIKNGGEITPFSRPGSLFGRYAEFRARRPEPDAGHPSATIVPMRRPT